jgi:hypothetical protein
MPATIGTAETTQSRGMARSYHAMTCKIAGMQDQSDQ